MIPNSACRKNQLPRLASPVLLVCASADELLMKDGSRLIGKVVKKGNGTLGFETVFAGVIKVQWAEVSELHTDEPASSIELGELAFINPAPWRLGEGLHWTGRVNLALNSQRGNTDTTYRIKLGNQWQPLITMEQGI